MTIDVYQLNNEKYLPLRWRWIKINRQNNLTPAANSFRRTTPPFLWRRKVHVIICGGVLHSLRKPATGPAVKLAGSCLVSGLVVRDPESPRLRMRGVIFPFSRLARADVVSHGLITLTLKLSPLTPRSWRRLTSRVSFFPCCLAIFDYLPRELWTP